MSSASAPLKPQPFLSLTATLAVLLTFLSPLSARENWLQAPNAAVPPLNQLKASGNACGPTALLMACLMGSEKWQKSYAAIPGTDDKSRILSLIKRHGFVRSSHLPTRLRYNSKKGINN
ncbi:MAG: hypothetical protein ACQKBY_00940, partial [Verrucomicrobiales bacterium]